MAARKLHVADLLAVAKALGGRNCTPRAQSACGNHWLPWKYAPSDGGGIKWLSCTRQRPVRAPESTRITTKPSWSAARTMPTSSPLRCAQRSSPWSRAATPTCYRCTWLATSSTVAASAAVSTPPGTSGGGNCTEVTTPCPGWLTGPRCRSPAAIRALVETPTCSRCTPYCDRSRFARGAAAALHCRWLSALRRAATRWLDISDRRSAGDCGTSLETHCACTVAEAVVWMTDPRPADSSWYVLDAARLPGVRD